MIFLSKYKIPWEVQISWVHLLLHSPIIKQKDGCLFNIASHLPGRLAILALLRELTTIFSNDPAIATPGRAGRWAETAPFQAHPALGV